MTYIITSLVLAIVFLLYQLLKQKITIYGLLSFISANTDLSRTLDIDPEKLGEAGAKMLIYRIKAKNADYSRLRAAWREVVSRHR